MSTHNSSVDHHVFVVGVARQPLENAFKNTAPRPSAETLMRALPMTEAFRQISPRNPGSEPIQNSLNEPPVIRRGASDVALPARQNVLDPIPLLIAYAKTLHWSALLKPTSYESHNGRFVNPPSPCTCIVERCSAYDSDPFFFRFGIDLPPAKSDTRKLN
jgi:hypothetical protein